MKILVTGGAGFIGSAVCRRFVLQTGWHVLNYDLLTYAANLSSVRDIASHPNYTFVQGDIAERERLDSTLQDFAPHAIVHLAAESHVDRSITGSPEFVRTNIVGTHVLLEAARAHWENMKDPDRRDRFRILHVSTDEVFGSLGETGRFVEGTPYDPRSPYAATKAASDHLVNAWRHTYGLPTLISNCSNNYGPYQFPEKLIPLTILKALEGEPLPVYGDGGNIRDWLYVDDHAAALECILLNGCLGETYNVGGNSERRNIDVVQSILDLVDELAPNRSAPRSEIELVADRPGHDRRYAIDSSKIEHDLDWRRVEDFESGLRRTVQWYIERRDWWEPIRTRFTGERLGLHEQS